MSLFVVFFLIAKSIGDDCTGKNTEAECGTGCVWTNLTDASCSGSGCGGSPICVGAVESVCKANAGCVWTPTICEGQWDCGAQTSELVCNNLGCNWTVIDTDAPVCVGAPTTCSGTSVDNCKLGGCTWSDSEVPGSCSGIFACENIESEQYCKLIKELSDEVICYWQEEEERYLHRKHNTFTCGSESIEERLHRKRNTETCSFFTAQGAATCTGVGCTWTPLLPANCSGTPTNAVSEDCAARASSSKTVCEGNGCVWHESSFCEGSFSGPCAGKDKNACEAAGGCSVVYEENCGGTNEAVCNGDTSTACESVHGCAWTPLFCSPLDQNSCSSTNGCTWNLGTGSCKISKALFVYSPAFVVILLLALFL